MEESTPRTKSRRTLDNVGETDSVQASPRPKSSEHIIDLRQAGSKKPAAVVKPLRRPAPKKPKAVAPTVKESPKSDSPSELEFEDNLTDIPLEESAEAAQPAPRRRAVEESDIFGDIADDAALATASKRFWPAFWRFLFLLALLGIIIAGGVYLYLNYFAS